MTTHVQYIGYLVKIYEHYTNIIFFNNSVRSYMLLSLAPVLWFQTLHKRNLVVIIVVVLFLTPRNSLLQNSSS